MADYIDAATIAKLRKSGNFGLYFQLDMTPDDTPLRLWGGPSDIMQTMTGVDAGPSLYRGVRLNEIREFEVMLNGGADRGAFFLEGVSADSAEKIAGTDPDVTQKPVYMGLATHDDNWQPTSNIIVFQKGRADFWAMDQPVIAGEGAATRVLSLSCAFGETGRSRPRRVSYSPPQQELLYPGDTCCKDVVRYHRGYVLTWPRF